MAQNIHWTSLYFPSNERCISEFETLNDKLEVQLKADLNKIYTGSLYTDLEILFDSGSIQTHSSLLKCRAPRFFSELIPKQSPSPSVVVLGQVDRLFIESFVREIYTQNKIREKEVSVVEYLSKLKQLKEELLTPESDVYVTPESSPTDVKYVFGQNRCASDSGLSSLVESADGRCLQTTNPLYYSLVTVDEVYGGGFESSDTLEKELAEQDQLFKSFKSIIWKESKSSKSESKSFTLASPLNKPINFQNYFKFSPSLKRPKKVKSFELKFCDKLNLKDKNTFSSDYSSKIKNLQNVVSSKVSEKIKSKELHLKEASISFTNVPGRSNSNFICEGDKQGEIQTMSKTKQEIDDIMEAESMGPDSCLEAASSGYLTGTSPREHTGSEIFGGDTTEVVTSEDIPHDNEQSPRSSSMSSDAGTWDSSFPPTSEGTSKQQQFTDENIKLTPDLSNFDSTVIITHEKGKSLQTNCNELNCETLNQFSKTNLTKNCLISSSVNTLNNDTGTEYFDQSMISQNDGDLPTNHFFSSLNEDSLVENKENKLNGGRSNFFIDAASLLDENEMSLIPHNSLAYNNELTEDNYFSWIGPDIDNKQLDKTQINGLPMQTTDKEKKDNGYTFTDTTVVDKSDLEMRRSSLIRRNTFELELDDERLAVLRQECERHKDKVQQDNEEEINIPNWEVQGILQSTSENSKISGNVPGSLPGILHAFGYSQKHDDEVHSPDSLNNDVTLENPFEEGFSKSNTSHSLPYEVNHGIINIRQEKKPRQLENDFSAPTASNITGQSSLDEHQENKCEFIKSGEFSNISNIYKVNKIESIPIISGGVSLKDLAIPERVVSSPISKRKSECTPIISGGIVNESEPDPEPSKQKSNSPFAASWVVDMGNTNKSPPGSKRNLLNDSQSSINLYSNGKGCEHPKTPKSNNSSLGFFVSLDDPSDEKSSGDSGYKSSNSYFLSKEGETAKHASRVEALSSGNNVSSSSSSCGFYVDLSDTQVHTGSEKVQEKETPNPDKKLFSMFIDISDSGDNSGTKSKTSSPHVFKKKIHTRTHSGVHLKRDEKNRLNDSHMSSESSLELTETLEMSKEKNILETEIGLPDMLKSTSPTNNKKVSDKTKKQGVYMFIEAESSPVPQRRSLPSGLQPNSQRHSWNAECHTFNSSGTTVGFDNSQHKKTHRRSHSVSVNKSLEVMFNVDPNENKSSSASPLVKISTSNSTGYESGPSSIDESGTKCEGKKMLASWHGSIKPSAELQKVIGKSDWREFKDYKITSSISKNKLDSRSATVDEMQESTDKNDETAFVNSKCDDFSNASNGSSNTGIHNSTYVISDVSNVANATSNELEITTPTCDVVSQLSKDDSDKTEIDFDDIGDKKSGDIPRTPDHSISQVEIPIVEHKFSFVKLSDMDKEPRKIPVEEKNYTNRMTRSIPEASWIESKMMTRSATSRSLSRLFPHLNTSARNLTPDSAEQSDFSEISSMQSSMDPSALEGSTEETDASSSCGGRGVVSRLGEDLLRMFLDEISPDVTVEVGGRRIKAHKCILSSRCQYFAAILSGGWVESAGNVISLQGFSYSAVHFALCHIYSGASNIPDSINIVELATLADMLCLEGLKEVIMYTLKVKYCHFFHKPCPMCTVGVLECLPLAAAYGLDEIYRKSLRWITRYFVRVWPTKGFATLPRELLDKCYKQHIVHMTVDNVLETVLCCSKLQGLIPNVRWAEPVFALATKLYEATVKFIAQHFSDILSSDMFMSLGKEQLWTMSHLEETLLSAAEKLPPDQACKCHSHLHKLVTLVHAPGSPLEIKLNHGFVEFLHLLSTTVEGCLLKQAARASRTPAWTLMEPQLRHKIQDAACLVIVPGDDRRRARHLLKREAVNIGKRSADLLLGKSPVNEHITTKKTPQPVRQPVSVAPAKPKIQQSIAKAESSGPRPKTWPYKISEVKSRYLEPKVTPKPSPAANTVKQDKTNLTPTARRNVSKSIISSSDSSRTSSPAMRRSLPQRTSRSLPSKRDDNLTMSTDSLTTTPSATGTKKKTEVNVSGCKTQPLSKIDFVERNMRSLSVKSGTKVITAETSTRLALNDVKAKSVPLRADGEKPKYSPIPLSKKSSSQSSPRVKDSPVPQVKSTVNSTPSPSIRRNTLSPKEKSHVTADTKSSMLKRTSTYRVQAKTLSPMKASTVKAREPSAIPAHAKGNINKIQSKKSVANNNIVTNNHKTDIKPQPMVGSRSGTFLKDEPTVLKKPQVVDVSE